MLVLMYQGVGLKQYYLNCLQNYCLGRITATHNGSGLVNSWNWNSSNFHADDAMDSSYTDQEHTPLYSLKKFSENQVEVCSIIQVFLKE